MQYLYHYTYRITNIKLDKHYYGSRSSKTPPKLDLGIKYFSSSSDKEFKLDQKLNPQDYKYKIVRIYDTRKEAIILESALHSRFSVHINEKFYNKALQPVSGDFMYSPKYGDENVSRRPDVKLKMSVSAKNRPSNMKGRKHSEESKLKQSLSAKNRVKKCRTVNYILISPTGFYFTFEDGSLSSFLKENSLSMGSLKNNINNFVPPLVTSRYNNSLRNNTIGWGLFKSNEFDYRIIF